MEEICIFYICYNFNNNVTGNTSDFTFISSEKEISLEVSVVFVLLHAVTWIFCIGGNLLICFIVLTLSKRSNKHYFLLSCAISDILMSTMCVPFTVISELIYLRWTFGETLCPVIQFLQITCVLQKSLNMLALNYEQYYSISNTMKKLSGRTRTTLLFVAWICPVVIAVPTALHSVTIKLPSRSVYYEYCVEMWDRDYDRQIYSLVIILFQFFIPLLLIVMFYLRIGKIIWTNKTPGERNTQRDKKISRSKRKGIVMLCMIIITFAATWFPLHALTIVGDWLPAVYHYTDTHVLWICFQWLAVSNSGTNCLIYLLRNDVFREEVKRLVSKLTCGLIYKQHMTSQRSPSFSNESDYFERVSFRRRINSSLKRRRTEF